MKKNMITLFLSVSILISSLLHSEKANAFVGLFIRNSTVKTFGQMTLNSGGVATFTGIYSGYYYSTAGVAYVKVASNLFTFGLFGALAVVVGAVILDDGTSIDLEFRPLSKESKFASTFTEEEIEIYNSEIEELNAIKNTIQRKIEKGNKKNLWKKYSKYLRPETIKIAEHQAKLFLTNLNLNK